MSKTTYLGSKKLSSLKDIIDSKLAKPCFDFLSKEDQQDLQKNFTPQNTQRSTHWALKVFSGWREARKKTKKKGGLTNLLLVISLRLKRFFLGQDKSSSTLLCIILDNCCYRRNATSCQNTPQGAKEAIVTGDITLIAQLIRFIQCTHPRDSQYFFHTASFVVLDGSSWILVL